MQTYSVDKTSVSQGSKSGAGSQTAQAKKVATRSSQGGSLGDALFPREALFPTTNSNSNSQTNNQNQSKNRSKGGQDNGGANVMKEASDMIQGFFGSIQKKVHEVFNDEELDESQMFVSKNAADRFSNNSNGGVNTGNHGGTESKDSRTSTSIDRLGGGGMGDARFKQQKLYQPGDPRNVAPTQQGMVRDIRKRPTGVSSTRRECDKSHWRGALEATGSNCRDLHHSHRVSYDVHRCLIVGTEIEFTCEGNNVKWIKVASKVWSPQQQEWVDRVDAHVRENTTTIQQCLKMLVDNQKTTNSSSNTGSGGIGNNSNNSNGSNDNNHTGNSNSSSHDSRSNSNGPGSPSSPLVPDSQTAMKNEVAAPITNQRPIFRRNRMGWDWPLSKECYRQRFIEVLKTECSTVAEEREIVLSERNSLLDKLESIQSAFH